LEVTIQHKAKNDIQPHSLLQQTTFWAKVKEAHGVAAKAFDTSIRHKSIDKGIYHKDVLITLHNIGDQYCMAYVPYGPVYDPGISWRGIFLEELSENLRSQLPKNCLFIRFDLPWKSPWQDDENRYDQNGNWMGSPEPHVREMRMNMVTHNWNLHKSGTNVLPTNTVFIDLQQNDTGILQAMKPKTRYNIRLAQRKGVVVKEKGLDEFPVWYKLYEETTKRNRITHDPPSYFRKVLQESFSNQGRNMVKVKLLVSKHENTPLAGMFLVISGDRATYLYGASSGKNRNLMGTYALQWEAIRQARKYGCRHYDMFGISETPDKNHPMYGLYKFKTGFGGEIYHRQGCWDYPFDVETYDNFRAVELNATGYHMQ